MVQKINPRCFAAGNITHIAISDWFIGNPVHVVSNGKVRSGLLENCKPGRCLDGHQSALGIGGVNLSFHESRSNIAKRTWTSDRRRVRLSALTAELFGKSGFLGFEVVFIDDTAKSCAFALHKHERSGQVARASFTSTGAKMSRKGYYSPALRRDLITSLYFEAKAQGIPMTLLADRLVESGLHAASVRGTLLVSSFPPAEPVDARAAA